jgi:hypothetical protein
LFWDGLAMRDGNWKFVTGTDGGLFDLDADLGELDNLTDKYPERAHKMAAAIERWKVDVATGATKQPAPPAEIRIKADRR